MCRTCGRNHTAYSSCHDAAHEEARRELAAAVRTAAPVAPARRESPPRPLVYVRWDAAAGRFVEVPAPEETR